MEFIAVTGKRPVKAAAKRLMPRALNKHPTTMEGTFSMLARESPPKILSKKILSIRIQQAKSGKQRKTGLLLIFHPC